MHPTWRQLSTHYDVAPGREERTSGKGLSVTRIKEWTVTIWWMTLAAAALMGCGDEKPAAKPLADRFISERFIAGGLPYKGGPQGTTDPTGDFTVEISTSGVCSATGNCSIDAGYPYPVTFSLCNGALPFPTLRNDNLPSEIGLSKGEVLPPGYSTSYVITNLPSDLSLSTTSTQVQNLLMARNMTRLMMMGKANASPLDGIQLSGSYVATPCAPFNLGTATLETDSQQLQASAPNPLPTDAEGEATLTALVACRAAGAYTGSESTFAGEFQGGASIGGDVDVVVDALGNVTGAMDLNYLSPIPGPSTYPSTVARFGGVVAPPGNSTYTIPTGQQDSGMLVTTDFSANSSVTLGLGGQVQWFATDSTYGSGVLDRVTGGDGYFNPVRRIVVFPIQGATKTWVAVIEVDKNNNAGGIIGDYSSGFKAAEQLTGAQTGSVITFNDTSHVAGGTATVDLTSVTQSGTFVADVTIKIDGVTYSGQAAGCSI